MTNVKNEEFRLHSIFIIESVNNNGKKIRGSGFAISENYILTANHNLVEDYQNIKVYKTTDHLVEEKYFEVSCIISNDKLDVALLEIIDQKIENHIDLYMTSINIDSEVLTCGYPLEKGYHDAPIKVKVTNNFDNIKECDYSFEVSQSSTITNYAGMSGAPVIYNKNCIGILVVQQGKNTLYAVSIKDILDDKELRAKINDIGINIINQEGFDYKPPELFKSPFKYCINCYDGEPNIKGIDIGFTFKEWNVQNFTELLYEWIIDYSLSIKERKNFLGNGRQLFKYAKSNYPEDDLNALADLCLHVAIRESYKTIPIMNKIIDIKNKTFSCTHAVLNFDKLELWIGASAVNKTIEEAVENAIKNIKYLIDHKSLNNRFYALTNQIDHTWPHQDKLKRLSDGTLPLDQRCDKIIIPVFIMHDSELINKFDTQNFFNLFSQHIKYCRDILNNDTKESNIELIDLRVFCFPVSDIQKLNEAFVSEINS
ncbi:Hachiman antiphage defense system protein HamA [Acinetobacter gerneri]|uniref:Hachiman antiphage defense system protein HamA n=1 Tax=Acinetobacter gerneri TaxID=202952 RepID=UPI0023F2FD50|nr:Hachiman antiphage defense system protein HamA [Acinetobacter gerneri]MCH4244532.1 SAVED domain-containing protein [Acinetobacter gerneri]